MPPGEVFGVSVDTGRALSVGEVAEALGLTPRTIKYYEELGLLRPERTSGNYRSYTERDVERLSRIKRMRAIGLSLATIREALKHESELDRRGARGLSPEALRSVLGSLEEQREVLASRIERMRRDLAEAEELVRALDSDVRYIRRRLRGASVEEILAELGRAE